VCRQHKAQYFYMAPKFPYSLPFDEQVGQRFYRGKKCSYLLMQVTMMICNNGKVGSKSSHKSFRTTKFVESAKKRRKKS
jgi:hypothetical protein